ncbi:MAG: protein kinase [Synergistaceae bacterium]|jgi:serine/threonine protein kinase|nr:protein kinase [Synergistaceae bacterium]
MGTPDITLKDRIDALTVTEPGAARNGAGDTIAYSPPGERGAVSIALANFRGRPILEQLPSKGSEADIYIVGGIDGRHILKLYRHRLEPKIEVLNRVAALSRQYAKYFVTFLDTGFDETTGRWYELQEYMPEGSLGDLPIHEKRSLHFISQFIPELTEALHCLHENGIVHCDLKPGNVLVRTLEPLDLVLTDFGISSLLARDMSRKMTSLKGTPMYWAPEAFSRAVGRPCDWWAFGMMLLELLAGKHPFAGMSDSQIIHRLTIGNVAVPESLGPEWGALVRGLLTKDDSLRWGKREVDRWLAGDRDIPVRYEYDRSAETPGKPFRFGGVDYRSARELAEAFASSEIPWLAAADFLRFLRQWMESNLKFEEASELGEAMTGDPVAALFRFVHGAAEREFCAMGHPAGMDALRSSLMRTLSGEASEGERRIAEMLRDGRLSSLYGEYSAIRGEDPEFRETLKFLEGKSPAEQAAYLSAFSSPDDYIWPGDMPGTSPLDIARRTGVIPMSRETIENLRSRFALPDSLLSALAFKSTYPSCVRKLEMWIERGLLLPRGPDERACKNMSADGYERAAKVRFMGHTAEALRKIALVRETAAELYDERPTPGLAYTLRRVEALTDEKITDRDMDYMNALGSLRIQREKLAGEKMMYRVAGGGAAGAACAAARAAIGSSWLMSDVNWVFAVTIVLAAALVLWAARSGVLSDLIYELDENTHRNRVPAILRMWVAVIYFYLPYLLAETSPTLTRIVGACFPLSGALLGAMIADTLYNYNTQKNTRSFVETCAAYSAGKRDHMEGLS